MQREIKRAKSTGSKSKKVGRPSTQPKAQNAKEYSEKKQKYIHKSKLIDPKQVAKVPQILHDIGQLETIQGRLTRGQYKTIIDQIIDADPTITIEEADAAIQGFKGKVRQQRIYGGFNPNDLIESNIEAQQMVNDLLIPQSQQQTQQTDADTSQNINARFNEPSHDTSSRSQPITSNRNTDQLTDFASQADSIQQDIDQEKAQNEQQKELLQDNNETNKDLEYIGGLDTTVNIAYRMIGLIRLYCPTSNNYITSVEPKYFTQGNGLSIRYLFGKQVDINANGTFTTSDSQPINLELSIHCPLLVLLNGKIFILLLEELIIMDNSFLKL
ncbi:MAG: hypothetical protein EZS28_026040 [Streblomastix strix]|uniref:Uncharacterized protein n=1 Tax=Streblomastix strix TaxID=222440 RepID=A0A5J4V7I7_9EUKA|nr:MAG: hypothetical protein EZS28_026040 [Streblomastix strix]